MKSRWFVAPLVCVAAVIAVVVVFGAMKKQSLLALRTNMQAVSQRYPKFTMEQRRAVLQEWQSEMHPKFRDISAAEIARRFLAAATATTGTTEAPLANFFGNQTSVNGLAGDMLGLERTSTCSLTMASATWMLSLPTFTYTLDGPTTANYDQILHNAAQLKTTGGKWPAGCGDPVTGIPTRQLAYLGKTTAGNKVYAGALFGGSVNYVEVVVANGTTDVEMSSQEISTLPNPLSVVAADLNGDGNPDLVVMNDGLSAGQMGSVSVMLGDANGDGGFGAPTNYSLGGETVEGAVIDDFNGDGKLDIVASSENFSTGTTTYSLSYLQGDGNGTFAAPQNTAVTPPSGFSGTPYAAMISADLRNNGKKDLIAPSGIVLLGNGDGTFTQEATVAFPGQGGSPQLGPNIVAADFNNDGKIDIALDNATTIAIFPGNGDGTFSTGNAYATINNTGYLVGTDLDGDGNQDLYSGAGSAGMLGGDQFDYNIGYALMGNGNGTFQGAPAMPFVFTGTNLADLNGDKIPDGVGVNATINTSNVSLTSYLGASNGSFTAKQTFAISPVTIGGTTFSFSSLDSFGLGDVTGSGKVDLVYLPAGFYGPGGVAGYFLAMGNGDGTFGTPTFIAAPTFAPTGDFDSSATISNLFVADVNGDGKADLIYSYSVEVYQTGNWVQGIAVQLSNGDGTFAAPQTIQTYSSTTAPTGEPPFVVQLGHTRASGPLDLFVETETNGSTTVTYALSLYLGNGDGTFGAASTPPVADNIAPPSFGSALGQIALADMNGDGKPDLITLGSTNNGGQGEIAISLGNGDGTFQTPTILDFGNESTLGYGLAAADFNGDGKMDIAVTGFDAPVDTGIFLGNGDGTLQSFKSGSGLTEPAEGIDLIIYGAATTADFNGDGKPDLVAGSAVLINEGPIAGTLTTTTTLTPSATQITVGTSVTLTAMVSASATPTGSVTFYDGTNALATETLNGSGVATYTTSSLSVGTHSITAAYAGNSTFAGSMSAAVTITVSTPTVTATTSTLVASATTVTPGTQVTFTDTVAPASGTGTPTGTVTFEVDGVAGTPVTLASGVATYQTTTLATGANNVVALYSGDSNFSASTSNAVTVTVQTATPTFAIGASPSSATVTAGGSTQTTITVTPANGFNQAVSFACTGLPTGGTCTFNPTTVTPNGTAAATTTLTIATATQSGALAKPGRFGAGARGAATLAFMAAGALWFFGRRRSSVWMRMLPLMVLLTVAAVTVGCGGSSGSGGGGGGGGGGSQTYTVTVTGTAGSQSQTATFTLTVS